LIFFMKIFNDFSMIYWVIILYEKSY